MVAARAAVRGCYGRWGLTYGRLAGCIRADMQHVRRRTCDGRQPISEKQNEADEALSQFTIIRVRRSPLLTRPASSCTSYAREFYCQVSRRERSPAGDPTFRSQPMGKRDLTTDGLAPYCLVMAKLPSAVKLPLRRTRVRSYWRFYFSPTGISGPGRS